MEGSKSIVCSAYPTSHVGMLLNTPFICYIVPSARRRRRPIAVERLITLGDFSFTKTQFLTLVLNRNDFIFSLNFRRRWPLATNVNIYFTLPAPMRLLIAGDGQQILYVFYAKAKKVITSLINRTQQGQIAVF